jgi:hypothetical protein
MIDRQQLEKFIIIPALNAINMYSDSAKMLLLYTCATESNLGTFVKQQFGGPALGIYQMEAGTYVDNWEINIKDRDKRTEEKDPTKIDFLKNRILSAANYKEIPPAETMVWDMRFATIMARLNYSRWEEPLPPAGDFDALIVYYYKYWRPNPSYTTIGKAADRVKKILFGR